MGWMSGLHALKLAFYWGTTVSWEGCNSTLQDTEQNGFGKEPISLPDGKYKIKTREIIKTQQGLAEHGTHNDEHLPRGRILFENKRKNMPSIKVMELGKRVM